MCERARRLWKEGGRGLLQELLRGNLHHIRYYKRLAKAHDATTSPGLVGPDLASLTHPAHRVYTRSAQNTGNTAMRLIDTLASCYESVDILVITTRPMLPSATAHARLMLTNDSAQAWNLQ